MFADQAVPPTLSSHRIRVVLVEDDAGTREIFLELLYHAPALSCVGAYESRSEAERKIPQVLPDVVLMDINLNGESGIGCVRRLKSEHPGIVFLMLTNYDDDDLVFKSLSVGASGYLLKRSASTELVAAIEKAHRGEVPMSTEIARKVVKHFHRPPAPTGVPKLSKRETEVLSLLGEDLDGERIAERLGITPDTVRKHIRAIFSKLHVRSCKEAIDRFKELALFGGSVSAASAADFRSSSKNRPKGLYPPAGG